MKFTVKNCFHWVGYHLIDLLLENGHHVIGIDQLDTVKKENLAMFVERNNLFTLREEAGEHTDIFIEVAETEDSISFIVKKGVGKHTLNFTHLIGEWMPERKVNDLEKHHEDDKVNEFIYVREIISAIIYWLENRVYFSTRMQVYSVNSIYKKKESLSNVFFKSHQSIDHYIEQVLNHYQQYRQLY